MRRWFAMYGALIALLGLGLVLRVYVPGGMVLVGDDLSALLRTHYGSWNELVEKGLKTDVHPPGIQVFLYFWNRVFTDQAWWVKLPFVGLSLLNVFLTWLLGRRLGMGRAADLAALFMSALQFPVFYGQLARMYAPGSSVLLGLSLVYLKGKSAAAFSWKRMVLQGILLAFAAYIHHLAALAAGIVWLTGFLTFRRALRWEWLGAAFLGLLLFLPAMPLWLEQVRLGGVGGEQGWLGKPRPDFFLTFLAYLFHYYVPLYLSAGLLFVLALRKQAWFTGLIWFVVPAFIAFAYSVLRNPVLQFSTLHFSLPFFLLFLSSGIDRLPKLWSAGALAFMLILVVGSLLGIRRHPYMQSKEPFKGIPLWMAEHNKPRTYYFCDVAPERWQWYVHGPLKGPLQLAPSLNHPDSLPDFESQPNMQGAVLGQVRETNPDVWAALKFHFPEVQQRVDFTGGMIWEFKKEKSNRLVQPYFKGRWNFEIGEKRVFFEGVKIKLDSLIGHESDWLYQEVKLIAARGNPPRWVSEIRRGEERVMWRSAMPLKQRGDTLWYASAVLLQDIDNMGRFGEWMGYAWAPDSAQVESLEISVECWPGNRIMDAPFKKVDWVRP